MKQDIFQEKIVNNQPEKSLFDRFLHSQAAGSIVLILAAITAIVWANSPWSKLYHDLSHLDIGVVFAGKTYNMGLAHWVKDGLMTIFFFVVGLEIKREVLLGELSSLRKAALPVMAALGGCLVPAFLYYAFNRTGDVAAGWGIPMATDIAFALGILALFGKRVPIGLKVFLTALAIVDDLMAVLVIAIFYTAQIHFHSLVAAGVFLLLFFFAVHYQARRPGLYLIPAIGVWASLMFSGIHATVAGVLIALLIPVKSAIDPHLFFENISNHMKRLRESGPLTRDSLVLNKKQWESVEKIYLTAEDMIPPGIYLEHYFHSVQAFIILPLFALFSAGVAFNAEILSNFPGSITLGIVFGLVFGKQAGILLFSWIAIASRMADMPGGVKWSHIWGTGLLGGIGFTMSIFISELAFSSQALIDEAKISIFIASFLSGIAGYLVLKKVLPREDPVTGA